MSRWWRSYERALLGTWPAPPLAVSRILIGSAAVLELVYRIAIRGLQPFDPETLHVPYFGWLPVPDRTGGAALYGVWLVAGLLFAAGWRTRLTGSLTSAAIAWYLFADKQNFTNHTYLLVLTITILVLGNAGGALSLDSRRRGAVTTVDAWAVQLLRAQLCIAYFWAGVQKANPAFLDGDVIRDSASNLGPIPIPDRLLPAGVLVAAAVAAMTVELLLPFALWSARTRPLAFALATLLHGSILVGMNSFANGITIFTIQWLGLLVLFVDPAPGAVAVTVATERRARILRALDWLAKLDVEVAAGRPARAVTGGERRHGLAATVAVLEVLPVSFLWAPLLRPLLALPRFRPADISPAT